MNKVNYKKHEDSYYKINHDLKRIVKLENNQVEYLEYDSKIDEIQKYPSIKFDEWKNIENSFFISRHFEWSHDGKKYRTSDDPIDWKPASTCGNEATIFHNGKIWIANSYYYPRISLERIENLDKVPKQKDYDDTRKWYNAWLEYQKKQTKWTDVKYCRHFEEYE